MYTTLCTKEEDAADVVEKTVENRSQNKSQIHLLILFMFLLMMHIRND
jgi:hypothetical protein